MILRVVKFREADRFVRLLVPAGEVLELLARSAGKSRKRFGGGLEPLSLQLVHVSQRRSTMVAEQAEHVNDYLYLREALERFYLASYAAERALGAAPCQGLFELMVSLLDNLEQTPPDLLAMKTSFDLKLLAASGVAPELERCVACGSLLSERPASLDPGGGGFDCPDHSSGGPPPVGAGVRALLLALGTSDFSRVPRLKISADERPAVRSSAAHFLQTHLGGAIQSEKLLARYL